VAQNKLLDARGHLAQLEIAAPANFLGEEPSAGRSAVMPRQVPTPAVAENVIRNLLARRATITTLLER